MGDGLSEFFVYLVAAAARSEIFVCGVILFAAERTGVFRFIHDGRI
jgi:hypothetical protein